MTRKLRVEYPGAIHHAHGNDDDIEVDRPTAEDGSGRSCGQLFEEKRMNSKANICCYAGLTPLLLAGDAGDPPGGVPARPEDQTNQAQAGTVGTVGKHMIGANCHNSRTAP